MHGRCQSARARTEVEGDGHRLRVDNVDGLAAQRHLDLWAEHKRVVRALDEVVAEGHVDQLAATPRARRRARRNL
eukprot:6925874-Prymnesium_polylepis.1